MPLLLIMSIVHEIDWNYFLCRSLLFTMSHYIDVLWKWTVPINHGEKPLKPSEINMASSCYLIWLWDSWLLEWLWDTFGNLKRCVLQKIDIIHRAYWVILLSRQKSDKFFYWPLKICELMCIQKQILNNLVNNKKL